MAAHLGTEHIVLFRPKELPEMGTVRLVGYDEQMKAGVAVCHAVAQRILTRVNLLAFGLPGTGKSTYTRALALKVNELARDRGEEKFQYGLITIDGTGLTSEFNDSQIRRLLTRAHKP